MSRSGYEEADGYGDAEEQWAMIRWRGAVASAIRGRRGQELLKALAAALDSMPEKRLIAHDLARPDGEVCALGRLGQVRGLPVTELDQEDHKAMAEAFQCAPILIREIEYVNDEYGPYKTSPEARWRIVRRWLDSQIRGGPDGR